ncbi:MAG: lipoyl(octanoyl) transferase LipB [Armatimonadota bacterium]
MSGVEVRDLGRVSYGDALGIQIATLEGVLDGTMAPTLLLVEHPPVMTLGASFHAENLLFPEDWYRARGIDIHSTDRGGDITYHGIGQLVAYPIFDVSRLGKDLHRWMRELEQAVIETIAMVGVRGERLDVNSGVWVSGKKICAIGIKMRRWVSMHGIALNCNIDLEGFSSIVPCGIRSHGVTSLSEELGRNVSVDEIKPLLIRGFERVFAGDSGVGEVGASSEEADTEGTGREVTRE